MSDTKSFQNKPLNNSAVNNLGGRFLLKTEDGSFTFSVSAINESYHSIHGAEQESRHVFIEKGFHFLKEKQPIRILEVGLGTGLNVLLTLEQGTESEVYYKALEPFPLDASLVSELVNVQGSERRREVMKAIHELSFDTTTILSNGFQFEKDIRGIQQFDSDLGFDLIYFDAFGPAVEPDLWTEEVLRRCYELLNPSGVWVSYCAKGEVRRLLQKVGFRVERLEGPPGKREMLRAIK